MEHGAGPDDSKIVGVGRKGNTMQSPLIEPPPKRVCCISSGSDEPLTDDLQIAGQKNQVDLVIGGDGSVTDDDSGSEDSDCDDVCSLDSDLDRNIFENDYGTVTTETWAKITAEQLKEINKEYMNFMKMAAAHLSPSQKVEDLKLLLASSRGSGSEVEYFFTFSVNGSDDGKVRCYEAKGIRVYNYRKPLHEGRRTDTLEFVRLKDQHNQLTASVST